MCVWGGEPDREDSECKVPEAERSLVDHGRERSPMIWLWKPRAEHEGGKVGEGAEIAQGLKGLRQNFEFYF